jgi:hypothetical protein
MLRVTMWKGTVIKQKGKRFKRLKGCNQVEYKMGTNMLLMPQGSLARSSGIVSLVFQHSPSSWRESELGCKVLDFCRREGFSEGIRNHVVRGTVDELKGTLLNDPANEVETNVDVFGASMVLMVLTECNG